MEDINFKINAAMGKRQKHHHSNIKNDRRYPTLVFSRPGIRGYYNFETIRPSSQSELLDVFQDGIYHGRMSWLTIQQKFGRKV